MGILQEKLSLLKASTRGLEDAYKRYKKKNHLKEKPCGEGSGKNRINSFCCFCCCCCCCCVVVVVVVLVVLVVSLQIQ